MDQRLMDDFSWLYRWSVCCFALCSSAWPGMFP